MGVVQSTSNRRTYVVVVNQKKKVLSVVPANIQWAGPPEDSRLAVVDFVGYNLIFF